MVDGAEARALSAAATDYSAAAAADTHWRPHDLAFVTAPALLSEAHKDMPDWAGGVLGAGLPVVVRRGPRDGISHGLADDLRLPVGIRGMLRSQRHASWIVPPALRQRIMPEAIAQDAVDRACRIDPARAAHVPALAALAGVHHVMSATGWVWGIGGAVGYELATGVACVRESSDIDLLLRMPSIPQLARLRALRQALARLDVRCDVQMETPAGGIALADWLGAADQVLVKSDQGPYLTGNPWDATASAANAAARACIGEMIACR